MRNVSDTVYSPSHFIKRMFASSPSSQGSDVCHLRSVSISFNPLMLV